MKDPRQAEKVRQDAVKDAIRAKEAAEAAERLRAERKIARQVHLEGEIQRRKEQLERRKQVYGDVLDEENEVFALKSLFWVVFDSILLPLR